MAAWADKDLVPTEKWDQLSHRIMCSFGKCCGQITWKDFTEIHLQNYNIIILIWKRLNLPYKTLSFFCIYFLILVSILQMQGTNNAPLF